MPATDAFSPATRAWFTTTFAEPTPAQEQGWPAIAAGDHTLILAPTGSGKTLAAFLWGIDRLMTEPQPPAGQRLRLLYISPLKALAADIERNLRAPLRGIELAAERLGHDVRVPTVGMRTGDTPANERRQMARRPPDILITTPESLYLLLTSQARETLRTVRWVVVDEVHAVAGRKRGAHLALSLERLEELVLRTDGDAPGAGHAPRADGPAPRPPQRIGLSATQRPLEVVARFLGGQCAQPEREAKRPPSDATLHTPGGRASGQHTAPEHPEREAKRPPSDATLHTTAAPHPRSAPRPVTIVDAGVQKDLEVEVVVPVEDMGELGEVVDDPAGGPAAAGPQRRSIWPAIHPRLLDLVLEHRSTLIFVNARRLAERLAARLNDLARERGALDDGDADLVLAHHGSLSRQRREQVENLLKRGELRALVATSSLELGIDMGAVDLVIQVASPGSVARGLQRVGRAGHRVGEPSRGRIFPKYRGDLVETAVVTRRMRDGLIEETTYPRNPLDVLAQQVVAMCAMDEWQVDALADLVRRAATFADLSDELLHATLDLLAGRYPSDEFSELRPRIVWDRVGGTVRGRSGAQRIAVTNPGTIPDRGLFGVFLPDGARVGELDEEMVHESRPGEVFMLGATSWRIEDITHERVVVTPAPGTPGKMPFWHGDGPGRPAELGRALGAFTRATLAAAADDRDAAVAGLRDDYGLDPWAADNLVAYLEEQADATGAVPDDRTVVVERFRDEIGDWRICLLTPFGARVHAPWAMAIEAGLRRDGLDGEIMWADDGIVLRLQEAHDELPVDALLVDPDEADELVTSQLGGTALFASRFRESAGRALLLPRRRPGQRTALWQQRQRAADLLQVAARYPSFPILLETTRECLRDVFDMPALRGVLADLRSRRLRLHTADTAHASPFAQSLLFAWVGTYMYEYDAPLAERRAAALALDRDLLRELLGGDELRELLDADVLHELELELQHLTDDRRARHADDVHDLLRRLGSLTPGELVARCHRDPSAWVDQLVVERRAIRVRVAGEDRIAAAEDAARLRDALGVALPHGLPDAFTEPVARPLDDLVARYARTHGPFAAAACAARLGAPEQRVRRALDTLAAEDRVLLGEFRPGGTSREWCDTDVLRRLRRRSLARLRREIEPVDDTALGRFLPAWQGVAAAGGGAAPRRGHDALVEALGTLQGAAIPASVLEHDVLPARVADYRPADLDGLVAGGELAWFGAEPLGTRDGRVVLCFRDQAPLFAPPVADDGPATDVHAALRDHLADRGASFWPDLVAAVHDATGRGAGSDDTDLVLDALWDLVWAGEVTNDTLAPLRAYLAGGARSGRGRAGRSRRRPRRGDLPRRGGPPAAAGRWSLTTALRRPQPSPTETAHALVGQLLERHGVITRSTALAEGVPGGFAGIYPVLRAMEEAGRVRRGYFVAGLGGAQFALPGAVERLRGMREADDPPAPLALAATDPAQPYGAALPWPDSPGHPGRTAGAHLILQAGEAVAYVERGGRSLATFRAAHDSDAWVATLCGLVKDGRVRRLELARIDGGDARDAPVAERLRAAGFRDGYRGLTYRG